MKRKEYEKPHTLIRVFQESGLNSRQARSRGSSLVLWLAGIQYPRRDPSTDRLANQRQGVPRDHQLFLRWDHPRPDAACWDADPRPVAGIR